MNEEKAPSDDALSAMPGDLIRYVVPGTIPHTCEVVSAGWQPAPKGGRVWTYETIDGEMIENTRVLGVTKKGSLIGLEENSFIKAGRALKNVKDSMKELVKLDVVDPSICAVTTLLLDGKKENLLMAKKLIDLRIQDLEAIEMLK